MIEQLLQLDSRIRNSFGNAGSRISNCFNADPLGPTLKKIRNAFDNPAVGAECDTVSAAVRRFRNTQEIPDFKQLRYVCAGTTLQIGDWCLVGDQVLWGLLSARAVQGEARRRLKCYQALLRSYWTFPAQTTTATAEAYKGWLSLRGWLDHHYDQVSEALRSDARIRTPEWFKVLGEHRQLLTDDPCGRYGSFLLRGDSTLLNAATEGLAIPSDSWVFDEAVYAQVRHCAEERDEAFRSQLPAVLDIVLAPGGRPVSRSLGTRSIARLVSRYSQCASTSEHTKLRDACLEWIGNPWLRKAAWDAQVLLPNGKPDDAAREMVHGWLRARLIKDFFELLTEEQAADQRRLNYWLRFEKSISDMWFILGNSSSKSTDRDFTEFKQRARGRILSLAGNTAPANNAFVMMIGNHAVVEFGIKGNACFVFSWDALPLEIRKKLLSGIHGLEIDIDNLRHKRRLKRLIHLDSPSSLISWEEKFDTELLPVLDATPSGTPHSLRSGRRTTAPLNPYADRSSSRPPGTAWSIHSAPSNPASESLFSWMDLEKHVTKHRLKVEDRRRKGGAFWVLVDNTLPELANPLRKWGFKYKPGKGWWKE